VILRSITILAILSLLLACREEAIEELNAVDHYVDDRLFEYFDNFKAEAAKRNIKVDYEAMNVEGVISNIPERGIAGQCQTYENGNKAIVIDKSYWNRVSDLKREFLVFHELGHCVLDRDHLDDTNTDGSCFSIMNSGGAACSLNYTMLTREALLEELFTNL